MKNTQFTTKVVNTINSAKSDKNGFVNGKYRVQESKSGGITFQHTESAVKALIQGLRRDMKLNNAKLSALSFLDVCNDLAKATTIESAMLDYKYSSTRQKIAIDAKTKQQRIASLSTRIKKAYSAMFGLSESATKSMNLSGEQVLQIVQSSASFFIRTANGYVAPVAKVKAAAKTESKKPSAPNRTRRDSKSIPAQPLSV